MFALIVILYALRALVPELLKLFARAPKQMTEQIVPELLLHVPLLSIYQELSAKIVMPHVLLVVLELEPPTVTPPESALLENTEPLLPVKIAILVVQFVRPPD
jgi:hypothetical protein